MKKFFKTFLEAMENTAMVILIILSAVGVIILIPFTIIGYIIYLPIKGGAYIVRKIQSKKRSKESL